MRIVIGGASGLIGTALTKRLRARGDQVIRLVRRRAQAADEKSWSPAEGQIDAGALLAPPRRSPRMLRRRSRPTAPVPPR